VPQSPPPAAAAEQAEAPSQQQQQQPTHQTLAAPRSAATGGSSRSCSSSRVRATPTVTALTMTHSSGAMRRGEQQGRTVSRPVASAAGSTAELWQRALTMMWVRVWTPCCPSPAWHTLPAAPTQTANRHRARKEQRRQQAATAAAQRDAAERGAARRSRLTGGRDRPGLARRLQRRLRRLVVRRVERRGLGATTGVRLRRRRLLSRLQSVQGMAVQRMWMLMRRLRGTLRRCAGVRATSSARHKSGAAQEHCRYYDAVRSVCSTLLRCSTVSTAKCRKEVGDRLPCLPLASRVARAARLHHGLSVWWQPHGWTRTGCMHAGLIACMARPCTFSTKQAI
jgi:hypothetical protein